MPHHYLTAKDPRLTIAGEEGPIVIPFSAVAAYHGHGALAMLAIMYQGLRGALPLLALDGKPVARNELSVVSGHPGPGVRDAFEFVTRACTRGEYVVDQSLPFSRYSRGADKAYGFILCRGTAQIQAALREGILPTRFFELLGNADLQARQEHAALRHRIAEQVLQKAPESLFTFHVGHWDKPAQAVSSGLPGVS